MSDETPTRTNGLLSTETRNLGLKLIVTILTAFGVSWWHTQISQNEITHRMEVVEEKVESNSKRIADSSTVMQQAAIQLALIGQNQTNALEQLKEVKQEQERIKNVLQVRR